MYPLNLHHKALGGFALANDEDEHAALSELGYEPKLEKPVDEVKAPRALKPKAPFVAPKE